MSVTAARLSFHHLQRLTSKFGLQEHSIFGDPRNDEGHCVDDVARALILLCREPEVKDPYKPLIDLYLSFISAAIAENGQCHNRMGSDGKWTDLPAVGDWWGRAVWAMGFAGVHAPEQAQRALAINGFRKLARTHSPHLHTRSFAVLGAGEFLLHFPEEQSAQAIVQKAELSALRPISDSWFWPEERLRYSNATIPEAVMLAGRVTGNTAVFENGLAMLDFLIDIETCGSHFSVTPVGGRGVQSVDSLFDQQPIELASIADASARAYSFTRNPRYIDEVQRAWNWFLGANDVGVQMFDPLTHGGYDGLHALGPNLNQGAESTISMLSTAQQAYLLSVSPGL
ncbi:MAG: hypothetical protein Q8K48_03105 [Candidatus Planktophila sp.]|nr:hypothetical protein [Candidatus Planktophila sp.]